MFTYDVDNELIDDHPHHQTVLPVHLHGTVDHLYISCIPSNVWIHVCNYCYEREGGQVQGGQDGDGRGLLHGEGRGDGLHCL